MFHSDWRICFIIFTFTANRTCVIPLKNQHFSWGVHARLNPVKIHLQLDKFYINDVKNNPKIICCADVLSPMPFDLVLWVLSYFSLLLLLKVDGCIGCGAVVVANNHRAASPHKQCSSQSGDLVPHGQDWTSRWRSFSVSRLMPPLVGRVDVGWQRPCWLLRRIGG